MALRPSLVAWLGRHSLTIGVRGARGRLGGGDVNLGKNFGAKVEDDSGNSGGGTGNWEGDNGGETGKGGGKLDGMGNFWAKFGQKKVEERTLRGRRCDRRSAN